MYSMREAKATALAQWRRKLNSIPAAWHRSRSKVSNSNNFQRDYRQSGVACNLELTRPEDRVRNDAQAVGMKPDLADCSASNSAIFGSAHVPVEVCHTHEGASRNCALQACVVSSIDFTMEVKQRSALAMRCI